MTAMKDIVGVLTWARNINYGGVLQAFALRSVIEKLGYHAELVHYEQNQADVSYGRLLGFTRHNRLPLLLGWMLDFLTRVFIDGYFIDSCIRLIRSRNFISRYICLSREYYPDYTSLCHQDKYGTIVVGSDQVWNPTFFNGVPGYLMAEMPQAVRKVAYAASISLPKIGKDIGYFKAALPSYLAISLREKSCIEELERECGIPVKWVVDPTLLLSATEWTRLLDLPVATKNDHITCYWLSDIEEFLPQLFSFAKTCNRKIHLFSNIEAFRVKSFSLRAMLRHLKMRIMLFMSPQIIFYKAADPRQFLGDLITSSAVISDSFHALMFSIVFEKEVRIIVTPERVQMASRIDDFLSRIDLPNIRADSLAGDMFSVETAYTDEMKSQLNCWVEASRTFLDKGLALSTKN